MISNKQETINSILKAKLITNDIFSRTQLWKVRRVLERILSSWPPSLLAALAENSGGYFLLSNLPDEYSPQASNIDDRKLTAVARLNAENLTGDPDGSARVIAQMIDHLLGSQLEIPVAYLSQGKAVSDSWLDLHHKLLAAFNLCYSRDELASRSVSAYFYWGFAQYCLDKQSLSSEDPLMYRALHSTLFSEEYWESHPLTAQS